ncbi:DUF3291 domain-containing protein [Photobacterium halotolerans]|uniref:DUF3291 domain-containing protein n=1 Tax=Photobacterium halotolerans TaxID=265726 RepID=A0A0F5VAZ3_9GAMM|nr:DUF3291 domain-containing protein [Photobacterium halotolerans]KKC99340.1 hypothetical protein KY46_13240 [Photobacterium halotolerans]
MKLAQLNIALAKYPMDAPEIKDFVDNLAPVNAIAESSEGFIWRLQDESGDATSIQAFDDPNIIVNMSVWESVDSLKNFMFRTHHRDIMRRKAEWFHRPAEDTYVLWWVEDDHIPTIAEAKARLEYLRRQGDSPFAFTFKSNFTPEDALAYQLEA